MLVSCSSGAHLGSLSSPAATASIADARSPSTIATSAARHQARRFEASVSAASCASRSASESCPSCRWMWGCCHVQLRGWNCAAITS